MQQSWSIFSGSVANKTYSPPYCYATLNKKELFFFAMTNRKKLQCQSENRLHLYKVVLAQSMTNLKDKIAICISVHSLN